MREKTTTLSPEMDEYLLPIPSQLPYIVKGSDMVVEDSEGKTYLDFMAGPGVLNIGHCHPDVVAVAREQVGRLTQCPGNIHNKESIAMAAKLARITPGSLKRCFFTNSGAESVEGGVKLAKKYASSNGKEGVGLVSLEHSFHGRLGLSLSLTGMAGRKKGLATFASFPGVEHIMAPYCYRCPLTYPACDLFCARNLEQLFKTRLPAEGVAAFICEPIMGVAGAVIPPREYLSRIREICNEHGVLLIIDEIFAGFGRTGKLFACEHFEVVPDIMTLAKALGGGFPLGAVITTEEVASSLIAGDHYTTFGWNNVLSLAAGLKGIDVLEKENLTQNAADLGDYFLDQLKALADDYPPFGDVRGLGLFVGVEVVKDRKSKEPDPDLAKSIKDQLKEKGFLIGVTGNHGCVLRLTPPLTIKKDHVDHFMQALREILKYSKT